MSTSQINLATPLATLVILFALLGTLGCGGEATGMAEMKAVIPADEHDHEESEKREGGGKIHLTPQAIAEAGIVAEEMTLRQLGATIELPGTVVPHPMGEAFVGSLVEGRVRKIFADVGDEVSRGDSLCTIESPAIGEAEAAYITTLADFQFVKADIERHRTLVTEGIGSQKELLELEARLASSSSAVSAAERTLHAIGFDEEDIKNLQTSQHTGGRLVLRSPIMGSVISRKARVGMQIAPETNLFHIVDLSRLRVNVDIPEPRVGEVAVGREVDVERRNGHTDGLKGVIERLGRSVGLEARTVTAYATVDNRTGQLRPGSFVTVRIQTAHEGQEILAVPLEAVFKDEHGDKALFIEESAGVFAVREVETGATVGTWLVITSGVSVGERVITQGAFAIQSEAKKSQFGDGHGH